MVAQEVEAGTPGCSSLARILTPESPLGEPQLGLLTIAVLTSEELPLLLIKRLGGSPKSRIEAGRPAFFLVPAISQV